MGSRFQRRRLRGTPGVVLALAAGGLLLSGPPPLQGQEVAPTAASARQGWIGIVYDGDAQGAPMVQAVSGRSGLVVKDVVAGSPAVEAGLRPGDVIVAMDGRPFTASSSGMLRVQAGQTLRLRIVRDGRVLESSLVAAPRPSEAVIAGLQGRTARVDSLRIRIIQEMDSLLERDERLGRSHSIISLYRSADEEVPVVLVRGPQPPGAAPRAPVAAPGSRSAPPAPPLPTQGVEPVFPFRFEVRESSGGQGAGTSVSWGWISAGVGEGAGGVPFGTFVLSTDRVDGLVAQLQEVRGSLEALRAEEFARQRELNERRQRGDQVVRNDAALQRVREAQRALLNEAERLEREMREEGRRSIERELPSPAWTPLNLPSLTLRPASPYVLGERMVAGAEVTALNPDLAEYFGGEEGLLVLQVIPGSPAAEAGFEAGDIVTRLGNRRVQTVDGARMALESSGQGPIPVTLVRRGRSVLVTLPR